MVTDAIASSLAKETRSSSMVGTNKTCSNRRSRENKYGYGDGTPNSVGSDCTLAGPIHYGGRSWE